MIVLVTCGLNLALNRPNCLKNRILVFKHVLWKILEKGLEILIQRFMFQNFLQQLNGTGSSDQIFQKSEVFFLLYIVKALPNVDIPLTCPNLFFFKFQRT